jgi:hypothetical protein
MYRRTFLGSTLAIACLPRQVAAEGATTKVAHIGWLTGGRGLPQRDEKRLEPGNLPAAKFVVDAHGEQIDVSR